MLGLEMLVNTILSAAGINPEEMKEEFTRRVNNFEENVRTLNNTLASFDRRLSAIETALGIVKEPANGNGIGANQNTNPVAEIGNAIGGNTPAASKDAQCF